MKKVVLTFHPEGDPSKAIKIEFSTPDDEILMRFFGTTRPRWGETHQPFSGIKATSYTEDQRGLLDLQSVIEGTLVFTKDLSVAILATWIYESLRNKAQGLRIEGIQKEMGLPAIQNAFEVPGKSEENDA